MKRNSFVASLGLAFVATLSVGFVNVTPRVIYGEDGRREIYEIEKAIVRDIADSTVALIPRDAVQMQSSGLFMIRGGSLQDELRVCASERFSQQPSVANCSGALVGADLIATAGHCVPSIEDCQSYAFVFGYRMNSSTEANMSIPAADVYSCKEIVAREYTRNQDYALVRLDRAVLGHRVLPLSSTPAEKGDEVYVVGHPSGLPTKVTAGGIVRSQGPGYFTTNLDTYGGNSGSPVLSASSHEVVGILVRGDLDYIYSEENSKMCRVSNHCPETGCRGEDVTNISYIKSALNQ